MNNGGKIATLDYAFTEGNEVNGLHDEVINGVLCKVYYPDGVDPNNVASDTQVALYMHGGNDRWIAASDAVNQLSSNHNVQSIVIIPNEVYDYASGGFNTNRANVDYYNAVAGAYDQFISDHKINQNNIVIAGHSSGYYSTFGTLDAYLSEHPNSDPASVFLLETFPQLNKESKVYDYNCELYRDNETMFYSYTFGYDAKNGGSASSPSSVDSTYGVISPLAKEGCNVMNILHPYNDNHNPHSDLPYHFFDDGIIDFANGKIMLPSDEFGQDTRALRGIDTGLILDPDRLEICCRTDGESKIFPGRLYKYNYQVWDPDKELWDVIDADKINTLDKIRNFFGIASPFVVNLPLIDYGLYSANLDYLSSFKVNDETVSNDSNVLLSNVNKAYNAISESNFVANKYACVGTASTTPVPADIPSVVNNYFSSTSSLLCNLADFLTECVNAGAKLDETERNIGKDAETVNNVEAISLGFASLNSILSEANTSNASNVSNVSDNNHNFERKPSDSDVQSKTENFSGVSGSSDAGSVWDEVFSGFDKVSSSDGKTSFYINSQ